MRHILMILFLSATLAAQINLSFVNSFTNPIFAGNGTIGVCTDSLTGNIWVVDFSNTINLHRFDVLGTLLSSHATNICTPAQTSPNDITQDRSNGDLWLVDNDSGGSVLRFNTNGTCLPGGFTLGSAYSNPVSITHNSTTNTLFIGHTNGVAQWSTAGVNLNAGFTPGGITGIVAGLTYVPTTNRYYGIQSGVQTLFELSSTGALLSQIPLATYGIVGAQAVDYDPFTGRVVIADNTTVTIHVFQDLNFGTGYQVNQPGASLTVNGITGGSGSPATINLALSAPGTLGLTSTNTGLLWDLGIGTAPLVSATSGGISTADGQVLNLDITDPTLFLSFNNFQSLPFTNINIPFSFAAPISLSIQLVVLDPNPPSFIRLSAPARVIVM